MSHAARVTMSMRELDRLKCIQAVVDGDLFPGITAERLGISTIKLGRIAQRSCSGSDRTGKSAIDKAVSITLP